MKSIIFALAKTHLLDRIAILGNSYIYGLYKKGVAQFQHFTILSDVCFRKHGMATPILFFNLKYF